MLRPSFWRRIITHWLAGSILAGSTSVHMDSCASGIKPHQAWGFDNSLYASEHRPHHWLYREPFHAANDHFGLQMG